MGHVGTGFTDQALRDLLATLQALHVTGSPFDEPVSHAYTRAARWVIPNLVGEIEHRP